MNLFEANFGRLGKLRSPHRRVWRFSPDGAEAVQLTNGPGGDGLPHPSPVDGTLAFVSHRALQENMSLLLNGDLGEWRRAIGWFDCYLGCPR
ncbi:hypothetical protein ATY81_26900 [Rhizobium sp. R72]|uniref:hypothetical protein n=1 Tax=unclassified Rhizobium TaxID=2613769 RepID=UPI000B52A68F|nr:MULTISPECIES: hypothetical protein [unclassified Rhizobium]OWV98657.1 hypothetical protein ATY81_26900 [Rhizobium sp. R72]OWV98691.1 hypothetical protein ATY80_26900 [Rhizobium sp. R711]